MPRPDSHIVEKAEPHGAVRFGMVPRRPDCAEGPPHSVVPALLHRLHDRAGGIGRGIEAFGRRVRVRIDLPAPRPLIFAIFSGVWTRARSSTEALRGLMWMSLSRGPRLERDDDVDQPVPGIRMPDRRLMVEEHLIVYESD